MGKPGSEFRTSDCELMSYFRRANLDMFWSKEASTVAGSLSAYKQARRNRVLMGMPPEIIPQGPYPIGDPYGMAIAVDILKQSQRPGKNSKKLHSVRFSEETQIGLFKSICRFSSIEQRLLWN